MTLITPTECKNNRHRIGVSQTALCELAGLRSNYVCRFEGSKICEPSGKKLVSIKNALEAFEIARAGNVSAAPKELISAARKELEKIRFIQARLTNQTNVVKANASSTWAAS